MSVRGFGSGGGGGGGGARMNAHSEAISGGATWHWPLDGDGVESVVGGGALDLTGTLVFDLSGPGTGAVSFLDAKRSTLMQTGAIGAPLRIYGAITVAVWLCRTANQAANTALVGARVSGAAEAHNFPWELGIDQATNAPRVIWHAGAHVAQTSTSATATVIDTWEHWCFTRPTAGTSCKLYKNGVIDGTEFTSLTKATGGTSVTDVSIGENAAGGDEFQGKLFSPIIYEEELSAAQVLALYNSTSSTGSW